MKEYIKDQRVEISGIKTAFAGLPKQIDIDDLTDHPNTFGPDGSKMP